MLALLGLVVLVSYKPELVVVISSQLGLATRHGYVGVCIYVICVCRACWSVYAYLLLPSGFASWEALSELHEYVERDRPVISLDCNWTSDS